MQPKAADGLEALSPEPNPAARCRARKAIGAWLLTGAALVGLMVFVGGVTRLTGSGLSITHWDIVVGTLPPLTDAAWEVQFTRYQKTPQYHLLNSHMGIKDFKTIFWWEYIHRLIGRLMGLVFVIPFVVFVRKGWIDSGLGRRLSLIFLLGLAQGALGWYMVKSGLVDVPWVSPYRLAAHLGLAFVLLGLIWTTALNVLEGPAPGRSDRLLISLTGLVFLQVLFGGLVAGAKAGLVESSFPLMGGRLVPEGLFEQGLRGLLEQPVPLQFIHRTLGWLVLLSVIAVVAAPKKFPPVSRPTAIWLAAATGVQFLLGVLTVMNRVPLVLAVLHQGGAIWVFLSALTLARRSRGSDTEAAREV